MSDLRTRIAAAIQGVDDWRGVTDPAILADAVIAELGLYREGSESRTVTNEFGATFRVEGGHRYVTDWVPDA
jgi:hypothetical protein